MSDLTRNPADDALRSNIATSDDQSAGANALENGRSCPGTSPNVQQAGPNGAHTECLGERTASSTLTASAGKLPSEPINRLDRLFFLKLQSGEYFKDRATIFGTLNFSRSRFQRKWGVFWVALCGGELRLEIENGQMPFNRLGLAQELPLAVTISRKRSDEASVSESKKAVGTAAFSTKPSVQLSSEATRGSGSKQNASDEFSFTMGTVSLSGSERNPCWLFSTPFGQDIIDGRLTYQKLGELRIQHEKCHVTGYFFVSEHDLRFEAEGGSSLSFPKRLAIRLLFLKELSIDTPISEHTVEVSGTASRKDPFHVT